MNSLETMIGPLMWASSNIAYNLDFVPDDKLTWKPAATANSALEVVDHAVHFMVAAIPVLAGEPMGSNTTPPSKTRDEAKQRIADAAQKYAAAMRQIPNERLGEMVDAGFGSFPLAQFAMMPVLDAVHHHGQIAYIQTLLGDTQSHFGPM